MNDNILQKVQNAPEDKYPYSYLRKGEWKEDNICGWTSYLNKDRAVLFFEDDTFRPIELVLEMVHDGKKGQSHALLYEHNWDDDHSYGLSDEHHKIDLRSKIPEQVKSILIGANCNYSDIITALEIAAKEILSKRKITADLKAVLNPENTGIQYIMAAVREKMIAYPLDYRIAKIEQKQAGTSFCIVGSRGKTPDQNFKSFVEELEFDMPFSAIKRFAYKEKLIRTPDNESTYQCNLGNLNQLKEVSSNRELSSAKVYDIVFSEKEAAEFNWSLETARLKEVVSSETDEKKKTEELETDSKNNNKKDGE